MINSGKILIIRFSSLGDLVLTTPIYRELKNLYPNSKITLLTSSEIGSVLENNPYIDDVIKHSRKETRKELKFLIKKLRKEKFDLIYDAHRSLRSIWIVWNLCGYRFFKMPKVLSIQKRSLKRSLLIRFKFNFLKNSPPQRIHLLRPLNDLAKIELKNHTELFPNQNNTVSIKKFMEDNKLSSKGFLAIGASASYPLKCWPLSNFFELIYKLLEQDWPIVLVGGKNENETKQIEMKFHGKLHNVAGKFSPLESAEILKHAFLAVTNDTSVSHLAEAMGTPALVFFGPTVKEFGYSPFLKKSKILETNQAITCRPCSRDGRGTCKNPEFLKCLSTITPEMVLSLIPHKKKTIFK